MSTVDQVAQATNSALNLRLSPSDLVQHAFAALGKALPEVQTWFDNKIGRDLRIIRVRAVHYSYTKNPAEHRWRVESVGVDKDYGGSRELLGYAHAGVEYATQLCSLLDGIEVELGRTTAGGRKS